MHDFVGARNSYFSALKSRPNKDLRNNIILRIGDTYLAEGNLKEAMYHNEQYYQKNNSINNINSLTMKNIHLTFLSGEIDTTKILIDSLITNTSPSDKYFNDLMELQGIISQHFLYGNNNDKDAFLFYVKAEKYLQEFKFIEATEMLSLLRKKYPNASIIPTAMLRECLLRLVVDDVSISLNIAKSLQNTFLAAEGIATQGEIYEKSFKDTEKAIEMYNLLIEDYPMSMLAEPVRIRIRKLNNANKS
jgi:tetratricopeptide (TPR) repeat protein